MIYWTLMVVAMVFMTLGLAGAFSGKKEKSENND